MGWVDAKTHRCTRTHDGNDDGRTRPSPPRAFLPRTTFYSDSLFTKTSRRRHNAWRRNGTIERHETRPSSHRRTADVARSTRVGGIWIQETKDTLAGTSIDAIRSRCTCSKEEPNERKRRNETAGRNHAIQPRRNKHKMDEWTSCLCEAPCS